MSDGKTIQLDELLARGGTTTNVEAWYGADSSQVARIDGEEISFLRVQITEVRRDDDDDEREEGERGVVKGEIRGCRMAWIIKGWPRGVLSANTHPQEGSPDPNEMLTSTALSARMHYLTLTAHGIASLVAIWCAAGEEDRLWGYKVVLSAVIFPTALARLGRHAPGIRKLVFLLSLLQLPLAAQDPAPRSAPANKNKAIFGELRKSIRTGAGWPLQEI